MKIRLVKQGDSFSPFDAESIEWADRQKDGKYFECDISSPRNSKFHRLFFKLLSIAYKHWTPVPINGKEVEKNFEHFRKECIKNAGYYIQVFNLDGTFQVEAESISFANMDDEEFKVLYDKILTVIIKHVLVGWSIEQIDEEIGRFL